MQTFKDNAWCQSSSTLPPRSKRPVQLSGSASTHETNKTGTEEHCNKCRWAAESAPACQRQGPCTAQVALWLPVNARFNQATVCRKGTQAGPFKHGDYLEPTLAKWTTISQLQTSQRCVHLDAKNTLFEHSSKPKCLQGCSTWTPSGLPRQVQHEGMYLILGLLTSANLAAGIYNTGPGCHQHSRTMAATAATVQSQCE